MKGNKYAGLIGMKLEDRVRQQIGEPGRTPKIIPDISGSGRKGMKRRKSQAASEELTATKKMKKAKQKLGRKNKIETIIAPLQTEEIEPDSSITKKENKKKTKVAAKTEISESLPILEKRKKKKKRPTIELATQTNEDEHFQEPETTVAQKAETDSGHSDSNDEDPISTKLGSSLREKLFSKLAGSRFRYINEQLYSITGTEAKDLFQNDPDAFNVYHSGYQQQCSRWPQNPLQFIANDIRKMKRNFKVADMGCGDAKLALKLKQKVFSFDLVAVNERVTACNIEKVPLKNRSVDVCVFCLSLMGTNLCDYILEANRILKKGGTLKIAEIASRFTSLTAFTKAVQKMGFTFEKKRKPNDYFILFDFVKNADCQKPTPIELNPCVYKKR